MKAIQVLVNLNETVVAPDPVPEKAFVAPNPIQTREER